MGLCCRDDDSFEEGCSDRWKYDKVVFGFQCYLLVFILTAPAFGIWGMILRAPHEVDNLPETSSLAELSKSSCTHINQLLLVFACILLAECFFALLSNLAIYSDDGFCLSLRLCGFTSLLVVILAKAVGLVAGVLFIWSSEGSLCSSAAPTLHEGAELWLIANLAVFGFQVLASPVAAHFCGLDSLAGQAWTREKWGYDS